MKFAIPKGFTLMAEDGYTSSYIDTETGSSLTISVQKTIRDKDDEFKGPLYESEAEFLEAFANASAGIEVGDVIVAVDGAKIKNMAQMQEMFTKHQPGDKVKLTIMRNKKEKEVDVVLKNVQGNTNVVKNADLDMLGATFKEVDEKDMRLYKVSYGLKVLEVSKGRFAEAGIKKGFVVQKVNNVPMKSLDDIQKAIKQANASTDQVLFISGVTPSGKRAYYSVNLSQE